MTRPPNLCYTLAFDRSGESTHRRLARLLVTSLLHTRWHGDVVVFRNFEEPVLRDAPPNVVEIRLPVTFDGTFEDLMTWKFRVRHHLDVRAYSKVLFLDCDSIALRNLDDLMLGSWDIYIAPEPGRLTDFPFNGYLTDTEMKDLKDRPGVNSGTWGVRASHFHDLMSEWERINARAPLRYTKIMRDQHSWNRLLLDTPLRLRSFAPGAIAFPFLHGISFQDYRHAALVHVAGRKADDKLALLYALWMATFKLDDLEALIIPPFNDLLRTPNSAAAAIRNPVPTFAAGSAHTPASAEYIQTEDQSKGTFPLDSASTP